MKCCVAVVFVAVFACWGSVVWGDTSAEQKADIALRCSSEPDFLTCVHREVDAQRYKQGTGALSPSDKFCIAPQLGQAVCFEDVNSGPDDGQRQYDLVGALPHWPSIVLVFASYWEVSEAKFISMIDGKTLFEMLGFAQMSFSPDGRYAAFTMVDEVGGFYDMHGAWLYEISDRSPWVLLWSDENLQEAYVDPRWASGDELRIARLNRDMAVSNGAESFEPKLLGELVVKRVGDKWLARPEAKVDKLP